MGAKALLALAVSDETLAAALLDCLGTAGYRLCTWDDQPSEPDEIALLIADHVPASLASSAGVALIVVGPSNGLPAALDEGADDYVVSPPAAEELLARVRAALRRAARLERLERLVGQRGRAPEIFFGAPNIAASKDAGGGDALCPDDLHPEGADSGVPVGADRVKVESDGALAGAAACSPSVPDECDSVAVASGPPEVVATSDLSARIMVVDDDQRLLTFLRLALEHAGYAVLSATDADAALSLAERERPELILLDLMLPGTHGFEVCAKIRQFSEAPIIILSGIDGEADKVRGLDLGADDFLTKPFSVHELLARVRAVLRRYSPHAEGPLLFGELVIDPARRRVNLGEREVKLTSVEYALLYHLATNAGRVVSHEELLERVWGPEYSHNSQYLWVHIRHLREKLEADPRHPRYLLNEHGFGYCFALPQ